METHENSVPIDLWIDKMSPEGAEETLKRLVRNSPGFFYRCRNDADWTMQILSGHFEKITGFTPNELVGEDGLRYADMILDDDLQRVEEAVDRGLERDGRFQVSYRIETKSGETRWLLEHGTGVANADGEFTHLEGFVSDISREKSLEHRLRHSQKLELVGRLAGGIAHDFNNLLSIIIGYGSLAMEELDNHAARQDLQEVIEAADRAKELSGQILSFSRYQASSPEVVKLDDFLSDKISMLARVFGNDMHIERDLRATGALVEIERTELEQVLLNLVTNARDAMRESGGTLQISSRVEDFGPDSSGVNVDEFGRYAVIDIRDEGQGIPVDIREMIFEPFFTTKDKDHGTGLGLATSSGIVTSAGGSIWFDTEIAEGTTFHIALPTADREPETAERAVPENARASVLIVDDDAKIRDLITRLLRTVDITTFTADGAKGARRLWATEGGFDMIIVDIIMPEMNGIALVRELLGPGDEQLPVLFLSGYTGEGVDQSDVRSVNTEFFKKPFTPSTLRARVLQMLDLEPGES